MSSTRQKDAPGSTSRPEESSEELGSRPGEDAGRERRSRSRSPGANASKSSTSASGRGHKKSRSKSKAKTGESASGCSRSTDALPPAEGSSDRGQGQDGGPGAVTAEGAGLVDVANLAPMIAALIDQKFGQMSNANHRDERRRRHRSTSSESSDTDSSDEADSTPEDSDDPEYGDGRHYGRDRSSTRNAKRGRHDARAAPRRRRSASAEPKHGGAQQQQHDSGSEDDSDPFAAIAQVAAASKSAQNTGNVDKYEQAIGDIAQFFDNGDKVGEKVEEKFASIFHGGLRRQPNDKLLLDMIEKYPRPENIAGLNVPKTNDVVWDSMKKGPQVVDASIQKVQTVLAKALVPVIHMVNDIGSGKTENKPVSEYLTPLTDVFRLGSAAFSLLNQTRKDVIRNDLGYPTSKICSWKYKVGQTELFEDDITKKLKELKEQNRQFRTSTNSRPSTSRGGFNYSRRNDRDYYKMNRKSHKNFKPRSGKKFHKKKNQRDCEYVSQSNNVRQMQHVDEKDCQTDDKNVVFKLDLNNTPKNFQGGKLAGNYENWLQITSDKWILDTIRGYEIEFNETPYQENIPAPLRLNKSEQEALDNEIVKFIDLGIVEECIPNQPDSFYSNLFTREKRDGSKRVILNLKKLTTHLEKHHFKMETVKDVILMMRPGCSFASIDFKHAFFSVKIKPNDRKYLRFLWNDKHYQFTRMPQGLGPASRVFTKILKPVFSHLRARGIEITGYIDDSLSVCDDFAEHVRQINYVVEFFYKLGFTINVEKSVLPPALSCQIEHLGFHFDSRAMTVTLTDQKRQCIYNLARQILSKDKVVITDIAQFVGKLVASEPGFTHAPLYYKEIEIFKNLQVSLNKGNYNASVALSEPIKMQIKWWQDNVFHVCRNVTVPAPEHVIESDASNTGWGGIYNNGCTAHGQWSHDEIQYHINYRELKGAQFMLQTYCEDLHDTHIRLKCDNTTAVACINRMASTKHMLMALTREIWLWALQRNINLSAEFLPGRLNTIADEQSRVVENLDAEWMVYPSIFKQVCSTFGEPDIDLFASRINAQSSCYVSWRPDPHAVAIDAFNMQWQNIKGYAFPPFSVIPRLLQKIRRDKARMILILPIWPTQAWFSVALRVNVREPVILPRDCLTLPQDLQRKHPLNRTLRLAAMTLSGTPSDAQDFLNTLPTSSYSHGALGHTPNIGLITRDGCCFVTREKLIRFSHL